MGDARVTATAGGQAELVVGGMSCGSCAARIERRLNRLNGVAASVNYATERAYFTSTGGPRVSQFGGSERAGVLDARWGQGCRLGPA